MNRRSLVASFGSGVFPMALLTQVSAQRGRRDASEESDASTATPIARSSLQGSALRIWVNKPQNHTLSLASNVFYYDRDYYAEVAFLNVLADLKMWNDDEQATIKRVLAVGEYNLPTSATEPRFDICGVRTTGKKANGVFVFSRCGNILTAHYTMAENEEGHWQSPADDVIYGVLERLEPITDGLSRESLENLLPTNAEAASAGLDVLNLDTYKAL